MRVLVLAVSALLLAETGAAEAPACRGADVEEASLLQNRQRARQPDDPLGGDGVSNGGFSTLSPDPDTLIWDPTEPANPVDAFRPGFLSGWLKVPVSHDPYTSMYEKSPQACLRVLMKPAAKQPAKHGSILLHCGGPGSDASCALGLGGYLEVNSSYMVGPPVSEDYDYWSISQRGMNQDLDKILHRTPCPFKDELSNPIPAWPSVDCSGTHPLLETLGEEEVLRRMDAVNESVWPLITEVIRGPDPQTFGFIYDNETYARLLYRVVALENNLCFNDDRYQFLSPISNRSYNAFNHVSTTDLAKDIEIFRTAIGAEKMSVYGISYGTKVGSVYATLFPDKVHRLILDGNMGTDPEIQALAGWVGGSTEAVWTGLAAACDNTVMAGAPPGELCPAGPGVTAKLHELLMNAETTMEKAKALTLLTVLEDTIYEAGVPCSPNMMQCIADMYDSYNASVPSCSFLPNCSSREIDDSTPDDNHSYPSPLSPFEGAVGPVLGVDLAGRLTEESFIDWWRTEKEARPLGIARSLSLIAAVATWPAIPRPVPPAGSLKVAPLVIGNLYDGQTPYSNAQRMIQAFPSGRLLTSQFYGHGLSPPGDIPDLVQRYEDEMREGVTHTYDNDVASLLCMRVALTYLKDGVLPDDYVCKAAGPAITGPGDSV